LNRKAAKNAKKINPVKQQPPHPKDDYTAAYLLFDFFANFA
jgi:hypothetical protein